jgi:hypothetical protein
VFVGCTECLQRSSGTLYKSTKPSINRSDILQYIAATCIAGDGAYKDITNATGCLQQSPEGTSTMPPVQTFRNEIAIEDDDPPPLVSNVTAWSRPSFTFFSMYALSSDHGEDLSILDDLSTFVGYLKATSAIARHDRALDNNGEATTKLLSIIAVDNPKRCHTIVLNVLCHNGPIAMDTVYSVATDTVNLDTQAICGGHTMTQIFVGTESLVMDIDNPVTCAPYGMTEPMVQFFYSLFV